MLHPSASHFFLLPLSAGRSKKLEETIPTGSFNFHLALLSFPSQISQFRVGSMVTMEIILGLSILVIIALFLLLLILICRPWRSFFLSPSLSSSSLSKCLVKVDDIEKPLISNDTNVAPCYVNDSARVSAVETRIRIEDDICSDSGTLRTASPNMHTQPVSEPFEDILVGQTLKRPPESSWHLKDRKHARTKESSCNSSDEQLQVSLPLNICDQRSSCLTLEVISGPSCGLFCTLLSTSTSRLPLTLGRVSPSDLLLKDPEVSGKHAMINWNSNKLKWELVDMGSMNGTILNSQVVQKPDVEIRRWSEPIELSNGDIITLGTTSKVLVQITQHAEQIIPFDVGVASDPMTIRRGGKKLPMEDVFYYQWPLPGIEQFGLFGIFDGHGGANAAKTASKTLPKVVVNILLVSDRRERVLSLHDASEVLRDAFSLTEAAMNDHQYEGCTATVLLVWTDCHEGFFVQCANVGDSACVVNVGEKQITMTEDHRIACPTERNRMRLTGLPLKDGETRLCGLNLARMLGDRFLKEQDVRFTPEPYISPVLHIPKGRKAFALMASDGLWDVISIKKATQLVLKTRTTQNARKMGSAARIADVLLNEARALRTKDNTSIIFLDFDDNRTDCKVYP